MKYAVFLLLFTCGAARAQEEFYPAHLGHMKGVKQCAEYYQVFLHNQDKTPVLWAIHYFDADGNDTLIQYLEDGKPHNKTVITYNDGQIVHDGDYGGDTYEDTVQHWNTELLTGERTFSYQDKKITGIRGAFYSGGDLSFTSFDTFFYENGRLSRHASVSIRPVGDDDILVDGVPSSLDTFRTDYSYRDTVTTLRSYFRGEFSGTEVKTYNKKGWLLSDVRMNDKGKKMQSNKYRYDAQGRLVEGNYPKMKDMQYDYIPCTHELISYDKEGRITEKKEFLNGKPLSTMTYKYSP